MKKPMNNRLLLLAVAMVLGAAAYMYMPTPEINATAQQAETPLASDAKAEEKLEKKTEVKAEEKPAEKTQPPEVTANALHSIQENDVVEGSPDAPVTIVEYSSLSCPHCAAFYKDTYAKLKTKYMDTGKVKFTNRQFPLNEPALKAGMLVTCVGKDRAKAFQKVLFEMQDKWAFSATFKEELKKIAGVGGFSAKDFDECMANKEIEEKVVQSRQLATDKLNVNSTPTFFVNGTELKGQLSVEIFDKAIEAATPAK